MNSPFFVKYDRKCPPAPTKQKKNEVQPVILPKELFPQANVLLQDFPPLENFTQGTISPGQRCFARLPLFGEFY
jgi:hypothetical protein